VQKGFETLTDPEKRRRYDSTLPFDDALPSKAEIINDDAFFAVFKASFAANSRFAIKKPCPSIGDINTDMAEVTKFYKYWDNFESWREFSQHHEHDPTEAEDRYQKRHMEKENKKVSAEYERKERARMIKLSELAYNLDPRIRKEREAKEAAKEAVKAGKRNHKADQRAAAEKIIKDKQQAIQDEKDAKAAKDKKEREERKIIQLAYKAKTKELIELCTEKLKGTKYDRFWVEAI